MTRDATSDWDFSYQIEPYNIRSGKQKPRSRAASAAQPSRSHERRRRQRRSRAVYPPHLQVGQPGQPIFLPNGVYPPHLQVRQPGQPIFLPQMMEPPMPQYAFQPVGGQPGQPIGGQPMLQTVLVPRDPRNAAMSSYPMLLPYFNHQYGQPLPPIFDETDEGRREKHERKRRRRKHSGNRLHEKSKATTRKPAYDHHSLRSRPQVAATVRSRRRRSSTSSPSRDERSSPPREERGSPPREERSSPPREGFSSERMTQDDFPHIRSPSLLSFPTALSDWGTVPPEDRLALERRHSAHLFPDVRPRHQLRGKHRKGCCA
ncbi:MAG: hypothetical protein KVP17_003991 [Porospora cf. gigantea B]|uniref:uncharacterized protein n=1 Tax=Porospora cf. gigantea B TaxID=2853592 RepID=UPI003571AB50|nr:MAG: hypothetical protein KVP17_003991 [Porospora cf. gigantea B]